MLKERILANACDKGYEFLEPLSLKEAYEQCEKPEWLAYALCYVLPREKLLGLLSLLTEKYGKARCGHHAKALLEELKDSALWSPLKADCVIEWLEENTPKETILKDMKELVPWKEIELLL